MNDEALVLRDPKGKPALILLMKGDKLTSYVAPSGASEVMANSVSSKSKSMNSDELAIYWADLVENLLYGFYRDGSQAELLPYSGANQKLIDTLIKAVTNPDPKQAKT